MATMRVLGAAVGIGAIVLSLAGCGSPSVGPSLVPQSLSSALTGQSVPPQSQFTTIECTVAQLLPDNTHGLGHQRFIVDETAPESGMQLEVDNDLTYGEDVPGLQVGEALTIRGVEYHDPGKDGIHWTHHANVPGDAGYIETPDGTLYQ